MKQVLVFLLAINGYVFAQTRISLIEEFTGEDCPPCATYNPGLDSTLALYSNQIIPIKWMVPIPSAPFNASSLFQTNKAEILWRYGAATNGAYGYPSQNTPTNSVTDGVLNAPSVRMDGRHQWDFGATSDHPYYTNSSIISAAQSQTTNFSITMNTAWDPTFSNCAVTVTVKSSTAFTSVGPLLFRLCLVERVINFSNPPGSNGETHFENAVRRSYPTTISGSSVIAMGTALPGTWAANQTQTFVVNCVVPSYIIDKTQMAFVGFVQDDGTRKVYQTTRTAQPVITAIETVKKPDAVSFNVYPNPSNTETNILLNTISSSDIKLNVINSIGQLVYSKQYKINSGTTKLNLDCKQLTPGIYTIVIESGRTTTTKKMVICE